jgi:hypothetical protein
VVKYGEAVVSCISAQLDDRPQISYFVVERVVLEAGDYVGHDPDTGVLWRDG